MPLVALLLLFIIVPLAELYVILAVGDAIGVIWTIVLLAADSVLGTVLLRSQGRNAWRQFNEALQTGRMPHREVQDGIAIVFGSAFLITPGFLTDIFGLLLLIPPSRAVIRRYAGHLIANRMSARVEAYEGPARRGRTGPGYDVEGTASEQPGDDRPGSERPHLER
jgi:UPF0716 protein FxsA